MTKQIHIKPITNNKTFHLGIYGKPKCHIYLINLYLSPVNLLYHFDKTGFFKNNPHYWLIKIKVDLSLFYPHYQI